jgi:fatty-acyl-CoA synthase/long-chain acyl-CoA synthetase
MQMTLSSIVDLHANKHPDSEALIFDDARATFSEMRDRVDRRANALLSLGVKKSDHVACLSINCMEYVETFLALWRIGAVFVPVNFRLLPEEMAYVVNHSDASTLLFLGPFEDAVKQMSPLIPKIENLIVLGERQSNDFVDLETEATRQSAKKPEVEVKDEDVAAIMYTAGTTGRPKGVMCTHGNYIWAAIAANFAVPGAMATRPKTLLSGPYFHTGGVVNFVICYFHASPQVVMKKFDPRDMLEWIQKERVNRLFGVSTLYRMMLQVPDIDRYDLSSVSTTGSGAETMPEVIRNSLKEVFPQSGIVEGYGMTESAGIISFRTQEYTDTKPYSVGFPPLTIEVRVVDDEGREAARNEVGEIIARGPNMMQGYYKDPEKTADSLRDGWLHTHDLGRKDEDGFLYIVERKNDMIKSGGENIYPKEVEDVLFRHPSIAEAAVFGVLDPIWGQNVYAAVVLKPGEQLSGEDVAEFCRENLASFKKPKHVEFVDSLPRSPIGKVLRSQLRERFKDHKIEE